MSVAGDIRFDRITRLLSELEYEVTRGMMDREIGEEISFQFIVPTSSKIEKGVVVCRFETKPAHAHHIPMFDRPKLTLVKS